MMGGSMRGGADMDVVPVITFRPGMKNITTEVILLEIGKETVTHTGCVIRNFYVADETASIHASFWGATGNGLHPGDIIRISGGGAKIHNNALSLSLNESGGLTIVGQFTKVAKEVPNMSLLQCSMDPNSQGITKQWMVRQPLPTVLQQLSPDQRNAYAEAFPDPVAA